MRVYLAAPWVHRDRARSVAESITNAGHLITHNWWDFEPDPNKEENVKFLRDCADRDVCGVLSADVVVVINSEKSEGKAVEQGIALANMIPVIVIGEKSHIFQNLALFSMVPDVETALAYIDAPVARH